MLQLLLLVLGTAPEASNSPVTVALCARYVRWVAAWLPTQIKPPILQWGGVVEVIH